MMKTGGQRPWIYKLIRVGQEVNSLQYILLSLLSSLLSLSRPDYDYFGVYCQYLYTAQNSSWLGMAGMPVCTN